MTNTADQPPDRALEIDPFIATRVLDSLSDGVLAINMTGEFIAFNPAAERLLGLASSQVLGQPFAAVFLQTQDNDDFTQLVLDAIYESAVTHSKCVLYRRPDGDLVLSVSTRFLVDADRNQLRVGVLVVLTDVTQVQELQAQQARMAAELQDHHKQLQVAYRKLETSNQQLGQVARRMQIVRNAATAFTLLLFLGLGVYSWKLGSQVPVTDLPAPSETAAAPDVATVQARHLTSTLAVAGRLEPLQQVNLPSPFSGKVKQVRVALGQAVEAGQVLLEMDTTEALVRQREAQSALAKAQAAYDQLAHWSDSVDMARVRRSLTRSKMALDNQQKTVEETTRLFQKGIIAKSELDYAQQMLLNQQMDYQTALEELRAAQDRGSPQQVTALQNERDNAQTKLEQITRDISAANVTAPVAGVVMRPVTSTSGNKELRQLEPGVSFQQGEILLSLGDLTGLAVRAKVDELDVLRLHPGQPVRVRAEAFAGQVLMGTVQSVSPLDGERDAGSGSSSFGVRVVVPQVSENLRQRLMTGMTGQLDVIVYDNLNALMLPLRAVQQDGGQRYVMRRGADGHPQRVVVETGQTTQDEVEITQGLKPGDTVLLNASSP